MADEPWYADDVVTDDRSATDAMHHLAFTGTAVAEALALLEADIPLVVEDWSGGARLAFDAQLPGILAAGHQLVAALTAAATGVDAALESGVHERQLRRQLRDASDAGTSGG